MVRLLNVFAPRAQAAKPAVRPPRVPEGMRVYAVGDIHGRLDLLRMLQSLMDADQAAHPGSRVQEVYLGDYVDRGPQSFEVIEALIARARERDVVLICGNHEEYMHASVDEMEVMKPWLNSGGQTTVASYLSAWPSQATPEELWEAWRNAVPRHHLAFLSGLAPYYVCGDYVFVHAGIRPGIPLALQNPQDLRWIRQEFLNHREPFEKFVVHGHTPVPDVDVQANRINIDTGAYATGNLTCLVLEGETREILSTESLFFPD